jgi:hypothetical protein
LIARESGLEAQLGLPMPSPALYQCISVKSVVKPSAFIGVIWCNSWFFLVLTFQGFHFSAFS